MQKQLSEAGHSIGVLLPSSLTSIILFSLVFHFYQCNSSILTCFIFYLTIAVLFLSLEHVNPYHLLWFKCVAFKFQVCHRYHAKNLGLWVVLRLHSSLVKGINTHTKDTLCSVHLACSLALLPYNDATRSQSLEHGLPSLQMIRNKVVFFIKFPSQVFSQNSTEWTNTSPILFSLFFVLIHNLSTFSPTASAGRRGLAGIKV